MLHSLFRWNPKICENKANKTNLDVLDDDLPGDAVEQADFDASRPDVDPQYVVALLNITSWSHFSLYTQLSSRLRTNVGCNLSLDFKNFLSISMLYIGGIRFFF